MKNTLISFRLQIVHLQIEVFTGNDRTDIMKKWNRPAMHFPACLKWIRSAGLKGYEKSKKNKRNLGDSDGWKEESGQNRENGMQGKWKSHQMVIETELYREEKQQIPPREQGRPMLIEKSRRRSRIAGGFFETDEGASGRGVSGIS